MQQQTQRCLVDAPVVSSTWWGFLLTCGMQHLLSGPKRHVHAARVHLLLGPNLVYVVVHVHILPSFRPVQRTKPKTTTPFPCCLTLLSHFHLPFPPFPPFIPFISLFQSPVPLLHSCLHPHPRTQVPGTKEAMQTFDAISDRRPSDLFAIQELVNTACDSLRGKQGIATPPQTPGAALPPTPPSSAEKTPWKKRADPFPYDGPPMVSVSNNIIEGSCSSIAAPPIIVHSYSNDPHHNNL